MATTSIDSPVGKVSLAFDGNKLCQLDIGKKATSHSPPEAGTFKKVHTQLDHYFTKRGFKFTIPVQLHGTDFQKRVWKALSQIPPGSTLSYGDLAKKLNSSPRAVGNACRANPIPIIIPCHRVVGKNGLGGYDGKTGGSRLAIKKWLLEHEGVAVG